MVAYKLGISLDMIKVQRASTVTSANSTVTGGSVTSEVACQVSPLMLIKQINIVKTSVRKVVGFNTGLVKSDAVSPTARRRCYVPWDLYCLGAKQRIWIRYSLHD